MKSRLLLAAILILAPLLMAAQNQAVLTVTVGSAGETETEVTVDGAGFRPNRPVEVRFVSSTSGALVATVTADVDSDGGFTVITSLTRPRGYVVEGWQQQGNHLALKARTQIFVP